VSYVIKLIGIDPVPEKIGRQKEAHTQLRGKHGNLPRLGNSVAMIEQDRKPDRIGVQGTAHACVDFGGRNTEIQRHLRRAKTPTRRKRGLSCRR
jgi:hypothetical protein